MPFIKFGIELNNKPDKTGRTSVMIRLHLKGYRPARVLTCVRIVNADKFWNPKKEWGKWVRKHQDSEAINAQIINEHNRIKAQAEK